jgi:hypothetical protein
MNTEGFDSRILGPPYRPVIRMPVEDTQHMARDAQHWGTDETGGALHGLFTHRGEPVVLLATEAGPGATREATHFAQDPEYVTAVNRELWRRYGIQYVGNWHSHHWLNLPALSGGDVGQMRGLAGRNGLQRMVQIVLTCEQERPSPRPIYRPGTGHSTRAAGMTSAAPAPAKVHEGVRPERDLPHIRVNAFVYQDAQTGSYTQAEVRTTECGSPFRAMLKGSNIAAFQDLAEDALYPIDRIILGNADVETQAGEGISRVLSILAEQVGRLPREVAERVEAVPTGSSIILRLPLSDDRQVIVHYDSLDQSLTPRSVHLTVPTAPEPVDITAIVLACKCAFLLDVVYECADGIQLTPREVRPGQQTPEMRLPITRGPEIAESKALSGPRDTSWGVERRHGDVD